MNIDPQLAVDCAMAAAGGFALGALAGRRMAADMRSAISAVQVRLSALEHKAAGLGASILPASNGASPALVHGHEPAAPVSAAPTASNAAALEHHASAVEKLALAIEKHAQAVDEHGAATVAAAVEMGSHPAPAMHAVSSLSPQPGTPPAIHPASVAATAAPVVAPQS